MIGYVVTLLNIPESVEVANRCIASGKQFNVDVQIAAGVYKDISMQELAEEGLKVGEFNTQYSNINAVIGNFVSQYRVWKMIAHGHEGAIVLEHDAVFVAPVPPLTEGDIINLGKPSYGKFEKKDKPGIYPMFSKKGGYIPGAHGYYVTPKGAHELIDLAKQIGAAPCDIYLCKQNFPDIKEIYPWCIEAHDNFSTIQIEKGCKAKHNFNKEYKILS